MCRANQAGVEEFAAPIAGPGVDSFSLSLIRPFMHAYDYSTLEGLRKMVEEGVWVFPPPATGAGGGAPERRFISALYRWPTTASAVRTYFEKQNVRVTDSKVTAF